MRGVFPLFRLSGFFLGGKPLECGVRRVMKEASRHPRRSADVRRYEDKSANAYLTRYPHSYRPIFSPSHLLRSFLCSSSQPIDNTFSFLLRNSRRPQGTVFEFERAERPLV